jgi:hypothetical protein
MTAACRPVGPEPGEIDPRLALQPHNGRSGNGDARLRASDGKEGDHAHSRQGAACGVGGVEKTHALDLRIGPRRLGNECDLDPRSRGRLDRGRLGRLCKRRSRGQRDLDQDFPVLQQVLGKRRAFGERLPEGRPPGLICVCGRVLHLHLGSLNGGQIGLIRRLGRLQLSGRNVLAILVQDLRRWNAACEAASLACAMASWALAFAIVLLRSVKGCRSRTLP